MHNTETCLQTCQCFLPGSRSLRFRGPARHRRAEPHHRGCPNVDQDRRWGRMVGGTEHPRRDWALSGGLRGGNLTTAIVVFGINFDQIGQLFFGALCENWATYNLNHLVQKGAIFLLLNRRNFDEFKSRRNLSYWRFSSSFGLSILCNHSNYFILMQQTSFQFALMRCSTST